jgi:hypothetical protein
VRQESQNVRNLTKATNEGTPQDEFTLKSMKKSADAGNEPFSKSKFKLKK